jgi:hypothetical protein
MTNEEAEALIEHAADAINNLRGEARRTALDQLYESIKPLCADRPELWAAIIENIRLNREEYEKASQYGALAAD